MSISDTSKTNSVISPPHLLIPNSINSWLVIRFIVFANFSLGVFTHLFNYYASFKLPHNFTEQGVRERFSESVLLTWGKVAPAHDSFPLKPASSYFLKNVFILFIYFWLCWVFVAARRPSLIVVSRGYSLLQCMGFALWWLLLWSTGSRRAGFSSCGTRAQEHRLSSCGTWA